MKREVETVFFTRDCEVERVPHGSFHEIPKGTSALVTQALGGSYTMLIEGQLVRLSGRNADAIGKTSTKPALDEVCDTTEELEERIWGVLMTCYDPEIPVNIVELGLIYSLLVDEISPRCYKVLIDMTLTAPGCGMGNSLANEVNDKVLELAGIDEVTVNMVFDPPWNRAMMSESALLTLGL